MLEHYVQMYINEKTTRLLDKLKIESASKISEASFAILKIISCYNLNLKIFP